MSKSKVEKELEIRFAKIDKLQEDMLNPELTEDEKLEKIEAFEKESLGYMANIANMIEAQRKSPIFVHKKPNT